MHSHSKKVLLRNLEEIDRCGHLEAFKVYMDEKWLDHPLLCRGKNGDFHTDEENDENDTENVNDWNEEGDDDDCVDERSSQEPKVKRYLSKMSIFFYLKCFLLKL